MEVPDIDLVYIGVNYEQNIIITVTFATITYVYKKCK